MLDNLLILFLAIFLVYVILHDWVSMPPFNNTHEFAKRSLSKRLLITLGNALPLIVALTLAIYYRYATLPFFAKCYMLLYVLLFFILMWTSWYKPYLLGTTKEQEASYKKEYGSTIQVLPAHGHNPRPNLMHVILHGLFLMSAVLIILRTLD
jgi:small-conductance mechanosensitive channel